jgi:hypothetical protein
VARQTGLTPLFFFFFFFIKKEKEKKGEWEMGIQPFRE